MNFLPERKEECHEQATQNLLVAILQHKVNISAVPLHAVLRAILVR